MPACPPCVSWTQRGTVLRGRKHVCCLPLCGTGQTGQGDRARAVQVRGPRSRPLPSRAAPSHSIQFEEHRGSPVQRHYSEQYLNIFQILHKQVVCVKSITKKLIQYEIWPAHVYRASQVMGHPQGALASANSYFLESPSRDAKVSHLHTGVLEPITPEAMSTVDTPFLKSRRDALCHYLVRGMTTPKLLQKVLGRPGGCLEGSVGQFPAPL